MNLRSLRFQLAAWYASLVAGAFVLLSLLLVLELSHYLKASLMQTQVRRAQQVAEAFLANVSQTGEAYVTRELKAVYAPEVNGRFFRITRQDGTVLYASGPPHDQCFNPQAVPPLSPFAATSVAYEQPLPNHTSLVIGAINYQAPDGNRFLVEAGAPTTPIKAMLDRLTRHLLVGLPLVLLAVVGGGYFLVHRALALVARLARKAENITQHNLHERLPVPPTGDELERLSVSLNHMITRLEEALLNAKRFGADASHELRTPLTVLRGELETVVQDSRLAPEVRSSLASMIEEVERLANTVEGLFAISRLDAGEAQTEWVPFDLAALVSNTADQMSLLAEDKHITIACETPGPVRVAGDRGRLKQVVVNLLDNAVKYTPEHGAVKLRVTAANGQARLEVEDNGIGIPADALPHIFERFFRVDKVRSREAGGAGLGLSIVKSICTAHGAEIEVQSEPGKGSRFRIHLPLAQSVAGNHHQRNNGDQRN